MLKTLLLTTALLWPLVSIAQDAQKSPEAAPPVHDITKAIDKICAVPTSKELGVELAKNYALGFVWDTPLTPTMFVRNSVYDFKVADSGGIKAVLVISTFFVDQKIVEQCVSSFGAYLPSAVDEMKKVWAEHPTVGTAIPDTKPDAAPLTPPPASGTVPTPKFQENPDE